MKAPMRQALKKYGISPEEFKRAHQEQRTSGKRKCYTCFVEITESKEEVPRFWRHDYCKEHLVIEQKRKEREMAAVKSPLPHLFANGG